MIVEIDPSSALPPYEQIRAQVADMAVAGVLTAGMRLPTIRQLAADLGVAPGTVARAYRELERDGVVVSRVRHGTTIAAGVRPSRRQTEKALARNARTFALVAQRLGATRDETVKALDDQLATLQPLRPDR